MTAFAKWLRALRRGALPIFMALLAAHWAAGSAGAQVYDVTGVHAPDVLNIRDDIPGVEHFSQAPVVGSFPADAEGVVATGRSYTLNATEWREVRHAGGAGWVNAQFLQLSRIFTDTGAFSCGGTEPFWDMELDDTGATVKVFGEDRTVRLRTVDTGGAAGWRNTRTFGFTRRDAKLRPIGVLSFNQSCSDGMSDFTYAYEFFLVGLDGGVGAYQGCCTAR